MKKIITEIIASWKKVTPTGGFTQYVVTTTSGATVWVPEKQFDSNAETISFEVMKAGDKYIKKDLSEGVLKNDRNNFTGCGKQIVKKYSNVELFTELNKLGIQPNVVLQ